MAVRRLPGCSKRLSSEAAASEQPRRTVSKYVEDGSDARTKLAAFFNILLMRLLVLAVRTGLGPGGMRFGAARAGGRRLVPFVGLDDLLDQLMADDVPLVEIDELDAGNHVGHVNTEAARGRLAHINLDALVHGILDQ